MGRIRRMGPSRWFSTVFVAVLAVAVSTAHGQGQQAPLFRGGVQTVALYATVTDSSGRLVPDLQQKDFDIYDNGKLQTITVFKSDVQPVTVLLTLDHERQPELEPRLGGGRRRSLRPPPAAGGQGARYEFRRQDHYQSGVHGGPRRAGASTSAGASNSATARGSGTRWTTA